MPPDGRGSWRMVGEDLACAALALLTDSSTRRPKTSVKRRSLASDSESRMARLKTHLVPAIPAVAGLIRLPRHNSVWA
jgi:hypothetical protein